MKEKSRRAGLLILLLTAAALAGLSCSNTVDRVNLRINPFSSDIVKGGETVVSVWAEGAQKLIAVRFTIAFDPALIEVVKVTTSGTGFIFSDSGAQVIEMENAVDNTEGRIVVAIGAQKAGFQGFTGSGTLAEIRFRAKTAGSGWLSFVDEKPGDAAASNYNGDSITGWASESPFMSDGYIRISETVAPAPKPTPSKKP